MMARMRVANPKKNPKDAVEYAADYVRSLMSDRVKELLRGALWDLYYGPMTKDDAKAQGIKSWPGYKRAVAQLERFAADHIGTIWVDMEGGEVTDKRPEPWVVAQEGGGIFFTSFDRQEAKDEAARLEEDGYGDVDVFRGSPDDAGFVEVDSRAVARAVFGALISDGGMSV